MNGVTQVAEQGFPRDLTNSKGIQELLSMRRKIKEAFSPLSSANPDFYC